MAATTTHSFGASAEFDYVLVGAGLQNALLSLALRRHRPEASVCLIEADDRVGGNHTWCFHGQDVPDQGGSYLDALVVKRWPTYRVAFPGHVRQVQGDYSAVTSERLHEVIVELFRKPGHALLLGSGASKIAARHVELHDGTRLSARLVVDARGPRAIGGACAFQKFVGLSLSLAEPAPLGEPLLMDARVDQHDGYRFVYVLPWSSHRVLIEDTYYSTSSDLDVAELRRGILVYAERHGYRVRRIEGEEQGVLPIPLAVPRESRPEAPLRAGYGGGWFHPTTGYSFPVALRLAEYVATRDPDRVFGDDLDQLVKWRVRQARFGVMLNRLLFSAFAPADRRHVLERFYRLPEAVIHRFYSFQTTPSDRARILCGAPPRGFSLKRALSSVVSP